jgi:hypothetical protein
MSLNNTNQYLNNSLGGADKGAIINRLRSYINQEWTPSTKVSWDWSANAILRKIRKETGIEATTDELIEAMHLEGFDMVHLLNDHYFTIHSPELVYTIPPAPRRIAEPEPPKPQKRLSPGQIKWQKRKGIYKGD